MAKALIPTRRNFMQGACAASLLSVVPLNEASARERVEYCYQQLASAMMDLTRQHGGDAFMFTCSGFENSSQAADQQTQMFSLWADEEKIVRGETYLVSEQIKKYQRFSAIPRELGSDSLKLT